MNQIINFFAQFNISKSVLMFLSPITAVLLDPNKAIVGLGLLILLDLITAIRASHIIRGIKFRPFTIKYWRTIRSNGLRSTWKKTYEYLFGITAFYIVEKTVLLIPDLSILGRDITLTELAINIAIFIELYSIFENLEKVSGKNLLKQLIEIIKMSGGTAGNFLKSLTKSKSEPSVGSPVEGAPPAMPDPEKDESYNVKFNDPPSDENKT